MNGSWEDEDEPDADPPVDPNEPVTVSPGCDANTRTQHEECGTRMCNHNSMDVATELMKVKPRFIAIIT